MPIAQEDFKRIICASVPKFRDHWLNDQQDEAAFSDPAQPLFIVAGPGTGKTTVLAVRILQFIFVQGYAPETILATTFTRKAANELRSRILAWGNAVRNSIIQEYAEDAAIIQWINHIDINLILTGTLDSLAQEAIENDRQPTEITPVVIELPMAKGLLRKHVLFVNQLYQNPSLKQAIANIENRRLSEINVPRMIQSIISLSDRLLQDLVDVDAFEASSAENAVLVSTIRQYWDYLREQHYMDFALLEYDFLQRIRTGTRLPSLRSIRAVFVDEFQDTNPLQEEIYYAICEQLHTSLTVVGDDDQSIYRFRGATVEIFSQFESRIINRLGEVWRPTRVDLIMNYRSTAKIVDFSNVFVQIDPAFQPARTPGKRVIEPFASRDESDEHNPPVLGMFRETVEELANDLAAFLHAIFEGDGYSIEIGEPGNPTYHVFTITRGNSGNWGDAVMLARTANEYTTASHGNAPKPRLPRYLRDALEQRGARVFNPRGRSIVEIPDVQHCLGLILLCIDNDAHLLDEFDRERPWAGEAIRKMRDWRSAASLYANDTETPDHRALQTFIADWANQNPSGNQDWPTQWPVVELLFTLMRWIPQFQNNPEGQIYLEVLARAITTAGKISSYSGNILFSEQYHDRSVKDIFQEVMLPLANGEIDVDEEIMPNVPRSYFPIMTIHQAKGLEFPLVIVDVGSDFKINSAPQRRFRYPEAGNEVHHVENVFSEFSEIGGLRIQRTELQRAFDDLRRQYFVADTRPQNILLLIGLVKVIQNNNIRAVQGGYSSHDATCHLKYKEHEYWTGEEGSDSIMLI